MLLRYPRIRLAVFNRLLSNGGDCVQALVDTARECGLRSPEELSDVRRQVQSGSCGSLLTARTVLEANLPKVADRLFLQLVVNVEQYKREENKVHCRGMLRDPTTIGCNNMAAVVMDLLLQLLEPYEVSWSVEPDQSARVPPRGLP